MSTQTSSVVSIILADFTPPPAGCDATCVEHSLAEMESVIRRLLRAAPRDCIDDIAQDVRVAFLTAVKGGCGEEFRRMLPGAVRKIFSLYLRRQYRARALFEPVDLGGVPQPSADPAGAVSAREQVDLIRERLTDDQWVLLEAKCVEGLSVQEIADRLGCERRRVGEQLLRVMAVARRVAES